MFHRPMLAAFTSCVLFAAGAARAEKPADIEFYQGFIDGDLAVTLRITVSGGFLANGKYQYDKHGGELGIDGVFSDGTFNLTEYDACKTTIPEPWPMETGKLLLHRTPDSGLSGTWTSVDGKRALNVALTRLADTVTLSAERPDLNPVATVSTQYPRFIERNAFYKALNVQLERDGEAAYKPKDAHPTTSLPEITFADDSLVSIRTRQYIYKENGYSTATGVTYVRREGRPSPLETGELLDARFTALEAFRAMCYKKITENPNLRGLAFDKDRLPTLNVMAAGLLVSVSGYDSDMHSMHVADALLPWKDVAAFIPEKSPLQRFLKKAEQPAKASADIPRPK